MNAPDPTSGIPRSKVDAGFTFNPASILDGTVRAFWGENQPYLTYNADPNSDLFPGIYLPPIVPLRSSVLRPVRMARVLVGTIGRAGANNTGPDLNGAYTDALRSLTVNVHESLPGLFAVQHGLKYPADNQDEFTSPPIPWESADFGFVVNVDEIFGVLPPLIFTRDAQRYVGFDVLDIVVERPLGIEQNLDIGIFFDENGLGAYYHYWRSLVMDCQRNFIRHRIVLLNAADVAFEVAPGDNARTIANAEACANAMQADAMDAGYDFRYVGETTADQVGAQVQQIILDSFAV